jgi:hypothetical protein
VMSDRPNSYALFRDGNCQHQLMMEKLYLIPQIVGSSIRRKHETTCWQCREYRNEADQIPRDPLETPALAVLSST